MGGRDRDRALRPARPVRRRPASALDPAQLPGARAHAFPAREDPPGDPAVLHRAQLRRPALRPRHPQHRLRAGQGDPRREGLRHRAQRQRGRLRVRVALLRAEGPAEGAAARAGRWPGLHPALRHGAAERLGNELRCAVGQRDPGAQRRRPVRRFRARHRRGRPDRVPPAQRRRPDLGDRQRLLRRAHQERRLRPGDVPRQGGPGPDQVRLAEAQPGREARYRRRAARGQGHQGDRRGTQRPPGREMRQPAGAQGVLHAARARALHRPHARAGRRQADRVQALRRLPARAAGHLQGDGRGADHARLHRRRRLRGRHRCRARWSTRTTSGRRSPTA